VEAAYDVLLMDNMKRRLSGEAAVAKSVRFADVPKPWKKVQVGAARTQRLVVPRISPTILDMRWCCTTACRLI
jgi:Protein CHAPERONE-LIKE PROTEIN OF POR1-like